MLVCEAVRVVPEGCSEVSQSACEMLKVLVALFSGRIEREMSGDRAVSAHGGTAESLAPPVRI